MKWVEQAFDHSVPKFLRRWPKGIHWVHRAQRLLYQRNALIHSKLQHFFQADAANFDQHSQVRLRILDAGCGDGHYLLKTARKSMKQLIALDRNGAWLNFLQPLCVESELGNQTNCEFICADLDDGLIELKDAALDVVFCFAVLLYLKDAEKTISEFSRILNSGGRLMLYSPVGFRIEFKIYRRMFDRFNHYELAQERRKIFHREEIFGMLSRQGFELESVEFAYGKWGRYGHEIWSMTTMLLGSGRWYYKLMGLFCWQLALLFLLFCNAIDKRTKLRDGNGMYCECVKR